MNPEVFPPPPPPSPNYGAVRNSQDGSLRMVVSLTEECHQLRQEMISQAQQLQEQQSYISELEEAIRELGDDYDTKLSLISDLNRRIESLEKTLSDKDKQHAKQLATMNKSHNEELEVLLQEFTIIEKQNANLQSQVLQLEDSNNAKDSLILDLKAQVREYQKLLSYDNDDNKLIEEEVFDKSDHENDFRSLTIGEGGGNHFTPPVNELEVKEDLKDSDGDFTQTKIGSKLTFPSFAFTRKKFSESDDDDDISPDKLTIRRDLSNKHYQKMKSHLPPPATTSASASMDNNDKGGGKSVTFAGEEGSSFRSSGEGLGFSEGGRNTINSSKSWKNDRKHVNTFQEIDLKLERSYFNWESGDSGPNTPDRSSRPPATEKSLKDRRLTKDS